MLNKAEQREVEDALRHEYGVDCRFVKGVLFVERAEDMEIVAEFADDNSLVFAYRYVEDDEFVY